MADESATNGAIALLNSARSGDDEALQRLFILYRSYLVTLARPQIHRRLQGKVDASDLAQETMFEAHRCFTDFRGTSTPEFAGWLRGILSHRLARHVRHYFAVQARDAKLECSLAAEIDNSSLILDRGLVGREHSPSTAAVEQESNLILADALEALPEDYRQVILLRHFEGLPFAEVAQIMLRSVDSVEKLWVRALARMRRSAQQADDR